MKCQFCFISRVSTRYQSEILHCSGVQNPFLTVSFTADTKFRVLRDDSDFYHNLNFKCGEDHPQVWYESQNSMEAVTLAVTIHDN